MEAVVVAAGSIVGVIVWLLRLDSRVTRHDESLHHLVPMVKNIEHKVDRIAMNCIVAGHADRPAFLHRYAGDENDSED